MSCELLRVLRPKSGIYVVNRSSLCTDAEVKTWTAACAVQVNEHVAPVYGKPRTRVQFLSKTSHAPRGAWVLVVLDDADQAGALGYHSETADGRVYGRVFAGPCVDYDVPVSTTLSHEVVETFCDPDVDQWRDTGRGYSVAYEACDAVEGDSYLINGVAVSDFVTPAWYGDRGPRTPLNGALHWMDNGKVAGPFQLAAGGYYVRRFPDGSEDQQFGAKANRGYIAGKRSSLARTVRRVTSKENQ